MELVIKEIYRKALEQAEAGPFTVVEVSDDSTGRPWYVRSKYGLDMGRFKDKEDAEAHAIRLDKVLNT
jgi:hypothetical protein